jgi:putative nucleotidyltransferase with HDIG domain
MLFVPVVKHNQSEKAWKESLQPFQVDKLIDNSSTDFDLYVRVKDEFVLYSGNGYHWEKKELDGLLKNGFGSLWIQPVQLSNAHMYEKISRLPSIEKNLTPHERITKIEQIGASFTKYLYEGELTKSCVRKAEQLAESVVECVREDPTCIQQISGLANHDMYTYLHSIRVSAYSTAIALSMGIDDPEHLKLIALGAIFHDIGKIDVPMTIINKQGPLLETEWQMMRSHPVTGLTRVEGSVLHQVCREIILHHHERLNGSGYPHGLEKNSLLPEVQIATLADIFDALTSSRSYQNKRSRFEALDFIKTRLLRTEISVEAFKGLVACLAPSSK